MPYIGHGVTNAGTFYILDDLTMSSSTTYTMQVGGVSVTPKADNLLITLDGVIQHTPDAYTVSGSTITFASAPGSGVDFYGIIMGQSASIGQGSIGADELKVTGDGSSGQVLASDGDGTFTWTTDTENYLPLAGGTMSGAINLGSQNVTNGGTITGTFVGNITGNLTGNASGTSATVTGASQPNITSVGTLTSFRSTGIDDNADALAITIDSSERVGIGTTSPDYKLEVEDSTTHCRLNVNAYNGSTNRQAGVWLKNKDGDWQINNDDSTSDFIIYDNTNSADRLHITQAGNVGIGTASPTATSQLHVENDKAEIRIKGTNDSHSDEVAHLIIEASTDRRAGITFEGDSNDIQAFIGRPYDTANTLAFETDATERMRIDASGNVGIGVTSLKTIFSAYKQLAIGANSSTLMANASHFSISENAYLASDGNWKQVDTGSASNIYQDDGTIGFRTTASGGGADTAITWNSTTINSSGNAIFGGGITAPSITLNTSGGGDAFDQYEEGTFTPAIYHGSTATTGVVSAGGRYRIVGDMMWINFYWYAGDGPTTGSHAGWKLHGLPANVTTGQPYHSVDCGYLTIADSNKHDSSDTGSHRWQANVADVLSLYGTHNTAQNTSPQALEFHGWGWLKLA